MKIYIITYIVGFISTLIFFIKLGKKIGFDYNSPKCYANQDDWDNNAEAYTAFSLLWPISITVLLLFGFFELLILITKYFIKD